MLGIRLWVQKACREVQEHRAELVAALLPARTDTSWWHQEIAGSAHAVLLRGAPLVIWGAGPQHTEALRREFPDAWHLEPGTPH